MNYLQSLRQQWGNELYEYVKRTMARPVVEPLRYQAPSPPTEPLSKKVYMPPSVENIEMNRSYVASTFGCPGLARAFPESQGVSYGWTPGVSPSGGRYDAANTRVQECKIMVTYFILCGETGFVKIGKSNRVGKRLASLQTANPHKLDLILCLPDVCGFTEEHLHQRFAKHRTQGEWFSYVDDLVDFVEEKVSLQAAAMDMTLRPTRADMQALSNWYGEGADSEGVENK